jgi:hypothetical protein
MPRSGVGRALSVADEEREPVMKRVLAAAAVAAALFAIPSPVAATGSYVCSYIPSGHLVQLDLTGGETAKVMRDISGHIIVNQVNCGNASVFNTDTIVVNGDASNQWLIISLLNGGFKPGFTDEAGSSDEVEFNINLGGSDFDRVEVDGTDAVDKIDLGQQTIQGFGVLVHINFNAGESTGIDWDAGVQNTEMFLVNGYGGNDVIRARGLAATGPDPLNVPLVASAGDGVDILKGGNAGDNLIGDAGHDKLWGYGGADLIDMDDGAGGDVGYGGTGVDTVAKNAGDTWNP